MRKRSIEIKTGFYLGKYEVTQNEYALVKNSSNAEGRWPSFFSKEKGAQNRPVESISFQDVRIFLNNLNIIEDKAGRIPKGWKYVLPTDDEFWYACYAGIYSKYPWGDGEILPSYANFNHNQTMEVGQFAPNRWGFYDLIGNVAELTALGFPIGGSYIHDSSYIQRSVTRGRRSHNGFRIVFKAVE
jgi:formylglycine-generating enzyme required for sulfatase activity